MNWWHRFWRRRQLEVDLDKELQFHIEQHVNELMAQGVEASEARRRASLALGGREQVKEYCRDARAPRWLENLWMFCVMRCARNEGRRDLRFRRCWRLP